MFRVGVGGFGVEFAFFCFILFMVIWEGDGFSMSFGFSFL